MNTHELKMDVVIRKDGAGREAELARDWKNGYIIRIMSIFGKRKSKNHKLENRRKTRMYLRECASDFKKNNIGMQKYVFHTIFTLIKTKKENPSPPAQSLKKMMKKGSKVM